MKIVILTTDNRQHERNYSAEEPYFGTAPEALLQGFAQLPEAEIHVISCLQQPVKSPEKIAPNIWYHSAHVPNVGWMKTAYQGCIRAVRRKIREICPDIVHGQGTERECAISAVFSGFPNVVTIHGNMAELSRHFGSPAFSFYWLAGKLEGWALKRTAGVFCNSAYTESLVAPRAKKVWRVSNPIRAPFFEPQQPEGERLPASIVNVGLISPRKRQVEILQMAEELYQAGHRAEFLFVGALGSGDYAEEFTRRIKRAEAAGYARYLGTKSVDDLISLFDRCAAMIHFPTEEAFGLVVAEGLARNLKFFGADLGGIIDITTGVELAERHPAHDWQSLKNGIARWIESGCPRPEKVAAEMAGRYHPGVIARRHLEIYREVLSVRR